MLKKHSIRRLTLFCVISFLVISVSSCSESSTSTDLTTKPMSDESLVSMPDALDNSALVDTSIFVGTWTTSCFSAADSASLGTKKSFIYDRTRAVFVTEFFQDAACLLSTGTVIDSGSIVIGEAIVESTFGVTANIFTFVSDRPESIGLNDILYTRNEQLFFGDENSRSTETQIPMALNTALPYEYSGFPDFSIADVIQQITLTLEVEQFEDASASNISPRAVTSSALYLIVAVDNQPVTLNASAAGLWKGEAMVDVGSTSKVEVDWSVQIDDEEPINLASFQSEVTVSASPINLRVNSSDYATNFDYDGDGVNNLTELNQGTDPYDPLSR